MEEKLYDLTNPQNSILLTEQYYQNTTVNSICGTAILSNTLNFDLLQKAISLVVKNNDSFRIHFVISNNKFQQYVSSFHEFNIPIIDIKTSDEISNIENNVLSHHFSILDSDLFEFRIFRFPDNTGGFLLNIHHLISDAWTLGLTCRKIVNYYDSLLNNKPIIISNDQSYLNYIETEKNYINSSKFENDKTYWENMFSKIPNIINIKGSQNNTITSISCDGNRASFIIPKNQMKTISDFCTDKKISVFNFFMSVLSIYIYKITSTNDFIIGTPILNRTNFNEKNTTGMFINIAPLSIHIDNESSFNSFAVKTAVDTMSLLRHQRYPYSEILKYVRKQDQNYPSLFNILLSYQVTKANNESDFSYTTRWAFNNTCADDIDIQLYDLDETGELNITYDYKTCKYNKKDIENIHSKLLNIINQILENPDINIKDINILSKSEIDNIIFNFNDTKKSYDKTKTIVELFEKQAKETPNNIAIKFENSSITYDELNKKANQIATFLRNEKNITSNDFVGIILNRSIDLIAGILGIVKSGATYVAIDPEYPQDRIEYMLANCNAKLLIINSFTKHLTENFKIEKINIENEQILECAKENLNIITKPENLLYVIYTSGSTGTPKGVSIKNYNVNNFIIGMRDIIDFSQTKAMVSVATVCFDMFVFELWGSLLNGITLVLANEKEQKLPTLLNKLCLENNVDIFQTTPSRFKLLFDNETTECFSKIKHILVGGEAVPENLFKKFLQFENINIHHMYGPTETTVWSTHKLITDCSNITIGKPIANTNVYILDENKNICPIGVEGEIYISGDGVGNGYLYNPQLTEDAFIKDPFFVKNTMYKTGDLGMYNSNGEITYLNRIGNQIKIRGFRVELGEIEKIIFDFPNIKNCVVVKKVLPNEHEALCAYYISDSLIDINELKKLLTQKLPAYMIPQYFIKLDDFPYTQNGKIDRKALPLPNLEFTKSTAKAKNRNKIDTELIKIVTNLFAINNIGIDNNLFDLGMDSLTAITLTVKILNTFHVQLNISDIFEHPIIQDLSDFISISNKSNAEATISNVPLADSYPVSSAQKRIYYASLVDGNNSTLYNVSGGIIFEELPDVEKLKICILKILDRHESFKTYFKIENGKLVQKINNSINFNFDYIKSENSDINSIFNDFIKPFSFETAPLFRAQFVELENNNKSILMIDTHHIICDGTSLNILINELCELYNGHVLPYQNTTYKDFAVWELSHSKSKKFKESENFWIEQFAEDIPVLNLPTTFPRPATKDYSGNLLEKDLNINITKKIRNICKMYNITPNIFLLSAFYILLYKYTEQNDIIIGTPIIGRELPELNSVIGMFVNTLPLRLKINGNSSVLTFLNKLKEKCAEDFSHQDYPFDTLVTKINAPRDTSRNFLFDVLFTYQTNNYSQIHFDGISAIHYRPDSNTSKFDISLEVLPTKDDFHLTFEYCTKLFDKAYIEDFSNHYIQTVISILDNINEKLSAISILSDDERNKVLYSFNNTAMQYTTTKNLANLIEEQVKKTPDNIAIVFEKQTLTYDELNKKANQLAWYLNSLGLKENSIIGIMLPRSLEVLVCMFAALKAGICYIPIDPTLPESRVEYMLSNSNASTILTFDSIATKIDSTKCNIKNILDVSLQNTKIYTGKYKNLNLAINPESPSYIIYTSGSTGKPKGVMLKQKALANLANYLNKNVKFFENEYLNTSMASITTISFDIFIFETLISMQRGLKIVMANELEQNTPNLLDDLIYKNNVTCIQMTPSRMSLFLQNKKLMPHLNQLKYIILAGEALPISLANDILKLGDITIYNGYGPSETTVFSTFTDVTKQKEITIGKPLGNTQIYILDKNLNPTPIDKIGEVYIAGDGVAIEYINNEQITKERFMQNPFIENSIMYKTGDLAKYLKNGELYYIGRVDNQVKIRGLRIELDEIEKCILKYKNIEKCIITAKNDSNNRQYIVAYLLVNDRISVHNLREFLKEQLPKYMIPTYFVFLDEIPYLPNGKIDKKSLPEPDVNKQIINNYVAPKTDLEIKIVNIFQNLLSISPIGVNDNFFELGGDSLLAINLQIELAKITNTITYADIFLNPTVKDLVAKIKKDKKDISENINDFEFKKYDNILSSNNILPESLHKENSGNILITGTTGFLGAHILREFLTSENGIAYCIIRPEAGLNTKEKLLKKLHYYFGKELDKYFNSRIIIIDSDISQKNLGISPKDTKLLSENISYVVNSAAKVAHFGNYELFKKINVDGVENLLKFCKKYNKRFYQISTVSISGTNFSNENITEPVTFYENNIYIKQSLDNVYIKSKFYAEKLILDYIKDGLDAYIIRVGNLMNRFSDLKFQPNVEENAFISRLNSFIKIGKLPEYLSDEYLEITPIDFCAKAIFKIVEYPTTQNRIFHVFNQNHVDIKDFIKILNKYQSFKIVKDAEFLETIDNILEKKNSNKILSGIIKDFDKNKKIQYRSNVTVNNDFSNNYLSKTNFEWPIITDEYLNDFIKYIINLK
jgi:fengycin family lipopeptide synthetase D